MHVYSRFVKCNSFNLSDRFERQYELRKVNNNNCNLPPLLTNNQYPPIFVCMLSVLYAVAVVGCLRDLSASPSGVLKHTYLPNDPLFRGNKE
jgi:hypothetical protein